MGRMGLIPKCVLIEDGDLKSLIHCAFLYSSYQVIVGNNTRHFLYFERQEMLTQSISMENTSLEKYISHYIPCYDTCSIGPPAFDSRKLKNEQIKLNLIFKSKDIFI